MVAWRPGHVSYIEQVHGDGTATVYDPNSGAHQTRLHRVKLRDYRRFVNPHGGKSAESKPVHVATVDIVMPISLPPEIHEPKIQERAPIKSSLAYYVYADTVVINPARLAMNQLRDVALRSPREEVELAADMFDVDAPFLRALVQVESSYNPTTRTGSYIGLCQLSKYEFERYSGGGVITDARPNAIACAHKLAVEAADFERAVGRYPTANERYMIHQQGTEGAAEHYARPDRLAVDSMCATGEGKTKGRGWCIKAICLNTLPVLRAACQQITSGQFVDHWKDRIRKFMAAGAIISTASAAVVEKPKKKRYAQKSKRRYAHNKKKRTKVASR